MLKAYKFLRIDRSVAATEKVSSYSPAGLIETIIYLTPLEGKPPPRLRRRRRKFSWKASESDHRYRRRVWHDHDRGALDVSVSTCCFWREKSWFERLKKNRRRCLHELSDRSCLPKSPRTFHNCAPVVAELDRNASNRSSRMPIKANNGIRLIYEDWRRCRQPSWSFFGGLDASRVAFNRIKKPHIFRCFSRISWKAFSPSTFPVKITKPLQIKVRWMNRNNQP